jgi:hypothetical protein
MKENNPKNYFKKKKKKGKNLSKYKLKKKREKRTLQIIFELRMI